MTSRKDLLQAVAAMDAAVSTPGATVSETMAAAGRLARIAERLATSGFSFDCDGCGQPLDEPGGILFGPSDDFDRSDKLHIGTCCYGAVLAFLASLRESLDDRCIHADFLTCEHCGSRQEIAPYVSAKEATRLGLTVEEFRASQSGITIVYDPERTPAPPPPPLVVQSHYFCGLEVVHPAHGRCEGKEEW